MALINGRNGAVTVGANSPLTFTNMTPTQWSVTTDNPPVVMSGFGDDFGFHAVAIPGWTASINYLYRRSTAATADVTDTGINAALKPYAWSMNFAIPNAPLTAFGDSWQSFDAVEGVVITGSLSVRADDTQAQAAIAAASAGVTADAVFALTDTTNDTITADIHLTSSGTTVVYGGETLIQYSYAVSDAPTFGAASPLTGYTAVQTAAATITGTLATGRTMAGGALLESLSIDCNYNQAIGITTGWRGTGALTLA